MKLTKISKITGKINLLSGLHIGAGNTEMHIGGTDNPVLKNPVTNRPYIPGSSIKGKMRSLVEWRAGVVSQSNGRPLDFTHIAKLDATEKQQGKTILKLFGGAPGGADADDALVSEIGPGRLAFWDCELTDDWLKEMDDKNLLLTEVKMENSIDRIKGVAENPRNTERVPAGAVFDFQLSLKVIDDENLVDDVLEGLHLLELTGLGGSGSRGYGKIAFSDLKIDGESLQDRLEAVSV